MIVYLEDIVVDCIIENPTSRPKAERGLAPELESTGNTQLHPRSPASFTTAFFLINSASLPYSLLC